MRLVYYWYNNLVIMIHDCLNLWQLIYINCNVVIPMNNGNLSIGSERERNHRALRYHGWSMIDMNAEKIHHTF